LYPKTLYPKTESAQIPTEPDEAVPVADVYESTWHCTFRLVHDQSANATDHVIICGDLDMDALEGLRRILSSLSSSARPLVFDLEGVTYMDIVSLGLLIEAQRNLSEVRTVNFYITRDGAVWQMIERHSLSEYLPIGLIYK
jgi:anti-anti-sigma factor